MSELIPALNANQVSVPTNSSAGGAMVQPLTDEQRQQRFADALAASTPASDTAQTENTLAADNKETEDRFLELLVAQMRNQDPMNPLENAEVTTQLAQINTVRGIEDMGRTLEKLLARFDSGNPVDAASMLGRQVLMPGDSFRLDEDNEGALIGGARVAASTSAMQADIIGSDGKLVRSIAMGPQAPGVATFEWDGRDDNGSAVDEGVYQVRVQAAGPDGAVPVESLTGARVTGITRSDESISYRVDNGTSVPADAVLGVF